MRLAGWHVIHDAATGRGTIDHIVIGPAGIFTVETKSHAAVGRLNPAWLRQAYAQSKYVERIVGDCVTPLLVFSRAQVFCPGARQGGVTLLPADRLVPHLQTQTAVLAPDAAASLHAR